jgi:hypothetical protein
MTMQLNQISESSDHEEAVCDDLISRIKTAQAEVNTTRQYYALVEPLSLTMVITVSVSPFTDPIPMTFGRTPIGLQKALDHINKYVTVSPLGTSSATDGNFKGVSA